MQKSSIISLILFATGWMFISGIHAQGIKPTGNSLAPAPEASALNKFIDIPVSYYTGTPNISAPIFNIQMQELSLPISLNYHASGLKVEEPSSWVGAGWALNAGGMINRNIRGLPDEYINGSNKGYFYNSQYYSASGGLNISALLDCDPGNQPISNYDALVGGMWDFEPDMYYFSMPGGSGKFTFSPAREPVRLSADDISIVLHPFENTPSLNNYPTLNDYKWRIRTPDGTTYYFESADKHTTYNTCQIGTNILERQNAWHLVKMEKGDDQIFFEYVEENIQYEVAYSNSKKFKVISVNVEGRTSGGLSSSTSNCNITNTVLSKRLSRIYTNNGYEVLFNVNTNSDEDREDLAGSYALKEIKIRKNDQLVKHIRLNQEYFGNNIKLKLKSIDQLADDGSGDYIRLFNYYYNENQVFPGLKSYQQDMWGYYNGATGNVTDMLPDWKDENYHFNVNTNVSRKPDLDFARIGTLKSIHLPTGGSQTFDYELHDFSEDNFLQTHEYEVSAQNGTDSQPVTDVVEFEVHQENSISFVEISPFIDGMDAGYYFQKEINGMWANALPLQKRPGYISKVGDIDVKGHRNIISPGKYRFTVESLGSYIHYKLVLDQLEPVKYEPVGGLRVREITTYDPKTDKNLHKFFEYTTGEGENKKSSGVVFTTPAFGGYYTEEHSFDQAIEYTIGDTDQSVDMTFLEVTDVEIVTPNDPNHKSYKKVTQNYVTQTINLGRGIEAGDECYENTLTVYLNLSASPQIPLTTSSGSHVGYSEVKIYDMKTEDRLTLFTGGDSYAPLNSFVQDSNKKLGYSAVYYINEKPNQELVFPFNRPVDLSYKNGKLLKKEVYARTTSGFRLLNQQINEYNEIPWINREFTSGLIVKPRVSYSCGNCDDASLAFAMYFHTKNWHYLKSTTTKVIENEEMSTKSINFYNTVAPYSHYFPIGSEATDSKGDNTKIELYRRTTYPAQVQQQETFVNGVQIGGEIVNYSGTLPSAYLSWDRELADYKQEITFNYGDQGTIEESAAFVTTTDPVKTTYLWGYNHSYMIAAFNNVNSIELNALLTDTGVSREWFNNLNNKTSYKTKLLAIQALLTNTQQMQINLFDKPYGPTETIDANGNSSYYIYDEYGRLKQVKDKDLNVLQEYELQYSNQ